MSIPAPTTTRTTPSRTGSSFFPGSVKHGSPFASHIYVPPSGAPGFAGDRNWNPGFEFDRDDVEKKSVRLLGRKEITTPVLSVSMADAIRPHLPALSRLATSWTLVYSLDQHGISLNTLYARCEAQQIGALVVMQDSAGGVFGAWVSEGIYLSKGAYYGSGDSFLWRSTQNNADDIQVYKWTGKNEYVALCEPEYLSFGGGEGHYGLYLDDTLLTGTTHPCPTFGNECLADGERTRQMVTFDCVGLEVWGIGGP
ncbi:TLD-domain-containing protein [Rickenella mellea]|uniref:Oxidation resistance protein 1 n=1 Tax=Rickenella mellea TaxID=50990 RepID=A0A4Y7QHH8_9AGAM|nr:TLD-domain-containing protein [Rickenella mellea]